MEGQLSTIYLGDISQFLSRSMGGRSLIYRGGGHQPTLVDLQEQYMGEGGITQVWGGINRL